MNSRSPLVAYTISYNRTPLSAGGLRTLVGVKFQQIQINRYASRIASTVQKIIFDQTTNRRTRFWLRPEFLKATQLAEAISGIVIVADVTELLKGLSSEGMNEAGRILSARYPNLVSAKHAESIRQGLRIRADLNEIQFKKLSRKKRSFAAGMIVKSNRAAVAGGSESSQRSNIFAKSVVPILRDILDAEPGIGPTGIADALNQKGVKSARGGQWYPSSAANLLVRCRKLGLI